MVYAVNVQYIKAPDVLVQDLEGEAVLLNLANELYFGLDEVGYRMYTLITTSASLNDAYQALSEEYEVEPDQLQQDFDKLVGELVAAGLITRVDE